MLSENWLVTFIAQIINFLVLVWLLKRFLYGPVVNAMERRAEGIAQQQDDAETARREAEREAGEFRRRNEALEHAREERLAEAGREVERWKQEHLRKAESEVERARAEWFRALERERNVLLQEIRRRTARQVYALSRHILSRLADVALERKVIDAFIDRLEGVREEERRAIVDSIRNSHHRILVESAFEIDADDRERIRAVIQQRLTEGLEIQYRETPELICGIELHAAGYKIAWSVAESLEALEEDFEREIEEATAPPPAGAEAAQEPATA